MDDAPYLFLQSPQLLAQVVVDLHELLHLGFRGGQSLLHLQVLLQRDGPVRQLRRVHALQHTHMRMDLMRLLANILAIIVICTSFWIVAHEALCFYFNLRC